MLTAIRTGGRPASSQSRPCMVACRSTQVSTSTIRPDSSARGTNSFGAERSERRGAPSGRAPRRRRSGPTAGRSGAGSGPAARRDEPPGGARSHGRAADGRARSCPGRRSRSCRVRGPSPGAGRCRRCAAGARPRLPSSGKKARPAQAVMNTSWPASGMGRSTAASSFSVNTPAASAVPTPWSRSTNTSLDSRATVSPARTARLSASGDDLQELVADGVAEAVVDLAEGVEVEGDDGERSRCERAWLATAWVTRSANSTWFGRPVSASWTAWWRAPRPGVRSPEPNCRRLRSRRGADRRPGPHLLVRRATVHLRSRGVRRPRHSRGRRPDLCSIGHEQGRDGLDESVGDLGGLDRRVGGLGGTEQRFGSLTVALGSEVLRQHDRPSQRAVGRRTGAQDPTRWRRVQPRSQATPQTAPGRGRSAETERHRRRTARHRCPRTTGRRRLPTQRS